MAEKFRTKPKILLGPGHWKGMEDMVCDKTEADFLEMQRNFKELSARGLIPGVAPGHDDDSPSDLTLPGNGTGAPLLGVAGDIWWDSAGNRLMTYLDEVPENLAGDIRGGKYRSLSAVIKDRWWDGVEGRYRNNVITEIGVLGLKWPGYGDQPDRLEIEGPTTRMTETGGDEAKTYRLSMADVDTTKAPDEGGGEDVEDKERKELMGQIETLTARVAELEAAQPDEEKETLKAELAEVKGKLELATTAQKAADEKIADAEVKAKEDVVDGVLTEAVTADKDGNVRMLPAEAETQKAVLMSMDDSQTIKLAEGEDGGDPVMASPFEQACKAISERPVVLKLAEKAVTEDGGAEGLHKGEEKVEEPDLTLAERKAAKGFGQTPEEYAATKAEMAGAEEQE